MYSVKVLSNEEFNQLPYKDVEVSLGLADPHTNTAYVRASELGELQKYVVNHEFDELVMSESMHEDPETGIRYKKFSDIGSMALPVIGGLLGSPFGPIGAGIGAGLGGFGGGLWGSGGDWGQALKQGAISGVTGGIGSALMPGLGGKVGSFLSKVPIIGGMFGGGATPVSQALGGGAQSAMNQIGGFAPAMAGLGNIGATTGKMVPPSMTSNVVGKLGTSGGLGGIFGKLLDLVTGKGNVTAGMSPPTASMMAGTGLNPFGATPAFAGNEAVSKTATGGGGGGFMSGIWDRLKGMFGGGPTGVDPVNRVGVGGIQPRVKGMSPGAVPFSSATGPVQPVNYSNIGISGGAGVPTPSTGGSGTNLMGMLKNTLTNPMGLGLAMMAGSQLLPKQRIPEMPASMDALRAMAEGGGMNPLAQQRLTELLNQDMFAHTEEERTALQRDLDESKAQEIDRLRDLYHNIRPGSDPTTDSSYRRDLADIERRYSESEADLFAGMRRDIYNDFQQNRLAQITASTGIDSMSFAQKQMIAQMDIDQIMNQFAIDYNDASMLKNLLLQGGLNMAMMPMQNQIMMNQMRALGLGGK